MGDELTILLEAFHKIEKSGGQATLSVSTSSGKTKIKLVTATTAAPPTESPSTSSTPARRHRCRGARARAHCNQRAAAHQASLAEAATSVPLEDPPPRRPLQLLPSPPSASGRRRVMSVGRLEMPTFSSLNLDGDPPHPQPHPQPTPGYPAWTTTARYQTTTARIATDAYSFAMNTKVAIATKLRTSKSTAHNAITSRRPFRCDSILDCIRLSNIFQCLMICFYETVIDLPNRNIQHHKSAKLP